MVQIISVSFVCVCVGGGGMVGEGNYEILKRNFIWEV